MELEAIVLIWYLHRLSYSLELNLSVHLRQKQQRPELISIPILFTLS
jgi:hypothetical protein